MRKTYNIEPIDDICLKYKGNEIIVRFDAAFIFRFQKEYKIENTLDDLSPTDLCANLIYCASKDITLDLAKEIVCQMDVPTLNGIIEDFRKSVGVVNNEELKELQKKTMQQYVTKLCKQK